MGNKYFYAVKFDAESQDSYEFNGKTYGFKAGGGRGTNEFALKYASRTGAWVILLQLLCLPTVNHSWSYPDIRMQIR